MSRIRWWLAIASLAAVAVLLLAWPARVPEPPASLAPTTPRPPTAGPVGGGPAKPSPAAAWSSLAPSPVDEKADAVSQTLWEQRLARAQETLDNYLSSTKYPPESRPMSEHPDQRVPMQHARRELAFKTKTGATRGDIRLVVEQDHTTLSEQEATRLAITCEKSQGPIATRVIAARARGAFPQKSGDAPVRFADDGKLPDAKAGDETWSAPFHPATNGFAAYHGRITVDADVSCEGIDGATSFDVDFTPATPARFTGVVREVLEDGSLSLYLGVSVKKAGRYVIAARVDDAGGDLAYVTFNDEIAVSTSEIKLVVFGKLLRDRKAAFPLVLRDVEGFLLLENTSPDRERMKTLEGSVHTTKGHALESFSDAEWSSEEKSRNVAELAKDVASAKAEVAKEKAP